MDWEIDSIYSDPQLYLMLGQYDISFLAKFKKIL